jgi:MoaA/NifB/PqqE/SkfB family radical SAM enzyme
MDFEKAKEFPAIVNVNVMTGRCPCSCVHCPVGSTAPEEREARFGRRSMKLSLFAQIAEEIGRRRDSLLRLHSVGEPLLWDDLTTALDILRSGGVKSWIFTSAVTVDRNLLEKICECISIIEVSVNATNRDEYIMTKGTDAFDLVSDNISHMAAYIKSRHLATRLLLSRVQTQDESADDHFVEYWRGKQYADDVFVRSYHNYNNLLDIHGDKGVKKPCLVHWARASIDCGGEMVCCFNELFKPYSDDVVLGTVDENTSIESIWKGAKLFAIRAHDMDGDFKGLGFNIPCENCTACQPVDTSSQTSEKQLASIIQSGMYELS